MSARRNEGVKVFTLGGAYHAILPGCDPDSACGAAA